MIIKTNLWGERDIVAYQLQTIKQGPFQFLPPLSQRLNNAVGVFQQKQLADIETKNPAPSFDGLPFERKKDLTSGKSGRVYSYDYYHYAADNSSAVFYMIGGLRSFVTSNREMFDFAKFVNASIVFIELPEPKNPTGFMPKIETIIHDILIHKMPEACRYKTTPKYLFGHSTGAACIVKNLWHSNDQAKHILSQFEGIRPMSTFLRPKYEGAWLQRMMYLPYAQRHQDKSYGMTLQDKFHEAVFALRGHDGFGPRELRLRHAEILYMSDWAKGLRADLLTKPCPNALKQSDKIEFWHGAWDNVADIKTVKTFAMMMDTPVSVLEKTFHSMGSSDRLYALFNHFYNRGYSTNLERRKRLPFPKQKTHKPTPAIEQIDTTSIPNFVHS